MYNTTERESGKSVGLLLGKNKIVLHIVHLYNHLYYINVLITTLFYSLFVTSKGWSLTSKIRMSSKNCMRVLIEFFTYIPPCIFTNADEISIDIKNNYLSHVYYNIGRNTSI